MMSKMLEGHFCIQFTKCEMCAIFSK